MTNLWTRGKWSSILLGSVLSLLLVGVALVGCNEEQSQKSEEVTQPAGETLKVALFQGHGGSETCVWETKAALEMDRAIEVTLLPTAEMTLERLRDFDVLFIPGGGGSRQYLNMGGEGRAALRSFVEEGGGVVGICAGAYLLGDTPGYASVSMSGGKAIDIEHDNRGRGIAKVSLTDRGKGLFPELADRDLVYIMYYEGPVVVPGDTPGIEYTTDAIMESDVHVEGDAPANMTNNKPFLYRNSFGKGKVVAIIAHPEATPGMQWMTTRLAHAAAPREVTPQLDPKFIAPDRFGEEILMDADRRANERKAFDTFLYGTAEEKIEVIEWAMKVNSWDMKRWIQGLLYDDAPEVRQKAAEAVAWAMYRMYLPDVASALEQETNEQVKEAQRRALELLK